MSDHLQSRKKTVAMSSRGNRRKRISNSSRPNKNKSSFFEPTDSDTKKRRKSKFQDDIIDSDEDSDYDGNQGLKDDVVIDDDAEDTTAEKKYRIAMEHIEKLRALTNKMEDDEDDEDGRMEDDDDEAIQGKKSDDLLAKILQKEHLEFTGRARRLLASRILKPDEAFDAFRIVQKHRQSVTAVVLTHDDSRGFSSSKDGAIIHWDVETGSKEKYLQPENVSNGIKKQSKNVLALAVSSDGRYLASGGLDRLVHLWDTRTRSHIEAFRGHKGPVSCLTFRQGTSELFSGSFDRMIKWWNVEDRCHINNLFGHQAEVLTIDCLRKEKILSVSRDRSLRLFKVLEESSLRFSTPTSALECCCFINNEEFLSGSDDGSVELWNVMRRKPAYIVKNAHTAPHVDHPQPAFDCAGLPNGVGREHGSSIIESYSSAQSWVNSVTVCRGSDLAASGAGNGLVRLWAVESEARLIRPLFDLPLVGFVNSLAFARSGRFLLAGVGQEPRLGRWGRIPASKNGVALYSLKQSDEAIQ